MAQKRNTLSGFTLVELMFVVAIIGILTATAYPSFQSYQDRARGSQAIVHMRSIQTAVDTFQADSGALPASLADVGMAALQDPWGNPYQYTNLSTAPPGKARKDKFLVPINSDYDLWSMGPDGKSVPPLTAKSSRDDIIRANDGSFYGRAAGY